MLMTMTRQAKALGLSVMLMPIVVLDEAGDGEWRGRLAPRDRTRFWTSYEAFILRYARISESLSVDLFSVGSELSSLESDTQAWLGLIRTVRTRFSGRVTYSANWDHFEEVRFWSSLDFIGISGYFELTKNPQASYGELRDAWDRIRVVLVDWSASWKRPLLFTELGYPSLDGGAVQPWNYLRPTVLDLDEQSMALRAFKETWKNEVRLCGVYFWNWWGPASGKNRWYTIPGKPAQEEVEGYFREREQLNGAQKNCSRDRVR